MLAAWLPTDLLESELEPLMTDPDWIAQEKADGVHVIAYVKPDGVNATNRRGEPYTLPVPLRTAIRRTFPPASVIDGEFLQRAVEFMPFDLLMLYHRSLVSLPYAARWAALKSIPMVPPVQLVRTACTTSEKVALVEQLMRERAEGAIFKSLHAPYAPGRPVTGGTMRRLKFRKRADVITQRRQAEDTKRSFEMYVIHDSTVFSVGSVNANTLDPDTRRPFYDSLVPGQFAIAEVSYLYAGPSYRLVQPVLCRLRNDKADEDCTRDQLVIGKRFSD